MINFRITLFSLIFCAGLQAQCVPGGLAVVVPKTSPTDSLSMPQLRKLLIGDVHTWPDKNKVTFVSTDPGGPVFKCVLSAVVRMTLQEYHKYLLSAEFRGDEALHSRVVDSTVVAIRDVAILPGTISIVEANSLAAYGALVKVVSINGKRPGEPGYPL
jgi:hypothetical protein